MKNVAYVTNYENVGISEHYVIERILTNQKTKFELN